MVLVRKEFSERFFFFLKRQHVLDVSFLRENEFIMSTKAKLPGIHSFH